MAIRGVVSGGAHPALTHRDGTTCIWDGRSWFVPLDAGGEGHDCNHAEHAEMEAAARADALERAAREHEAQLVCCDVFDRLGPGDGTERRAPWTDEERREYKHHDICYWGAACAEGDRARAREIKEGA